MELDWVPIPDFPDYLVSNYGDIVNVHTGRWMKQSTTHGGVVKVGLISGNKQRTRSVAVLVAEAFCSGRTALFDTPIHLDGRRENNRADNLVWRPRWFAWAYSSQFTGRDDNAFIGPIRDMATGERYMSVLEAAVVNGLLMEGVRKSIALGEACFPTSQHFEMI
jgi:NUMOD4 motif